MKSWTEISSDRLAGNFAALQQIVAGDAAGRDGAAERDASLAGPALLAVIKANAYGHGVDPCAAILARAGAEWLGVTDAAEGAEVRRVLAEAGLERQPKVLVMCGTAGLPGEAELMVRQQLTPVVWSMAHIERVAAAAQACGAEQPIAVHVEIDSGMTRQGVASGAGLERVLEAIRQEPLLELGGVFTHFASAEVANSPQTEAQQKTFEAAIAQVTASGIRPEWVHVGNSSFIDNDEGGYCASGTDAGESPMDWLSAQAAKVGARAMVRSGIALYGYLLPIVNSDADEVRSLAREQIAPVMTWKTRVIAVNQVPAGAAVGYNGTYVTEKPMRTALLPMGYADGLRRELSSTSERGGGWVVIRGARAPIVGRVSMNLTTVDVTSIPDAATDDEAVLLGEGITAEDHARLAGTIAYEILCGVRTSP